MLKETVRFVADLCEEYPEIQNVMCGLRSAYCERGAVSREFFELTKIYCHRLDWADDFREVDDRILKFAVTVPDEKTYYYYDMFRERLEGRLEPTTSGHGAIDLILPGCHKASGLKRLAKRCRQMGAFLVLDECFEDFLEEPGFLGVHPNDNTATVWLKTGDMLEILREHGNPVNVVEI